MSGIFAWSHDDETSHLTSRFYDQHGSACVGRGHRARPDHATYCNAAEHDATAYNGTAKLGGAAAIGSCPELHYATSCRAPPATTPSSSATYNSSQGQLTVNSKTGNVPSTASPPSFEQLSGGSTMITQEQAQAYPPLANDFIHVAGHSDHINKSQYEHWLQNLN
jgi:hypothetical protein